MVKSKSKPVRLTGKKRSLWRELKEEKFFYIIAIPAIAMLILFNYVPMAGIYLAFEKYSYKGGLFGSEFVGLDNFKTFFANWKYVLRASRNSLVLSVGGSVFGITLNVLVACILGEIRNERYRKTVQAVTIFPHFLSWIVVGVIADMLLNDKTGIVNNIIQSLGGDPIAWSSSPMYWPTIIILFGLWKGFGYGSIVYYATLTSFDPGLYEAAELDGASRFQRIMRITIPMLMPTISLMFLLGIGGVLAGGGIDQIMGLTKNSSMLYETTQTLPMYVYNATMGKTDYGMSATVSLYQSIVGCALVLLSNFLAKKMDPDYALF